MGTSTQFFSEASQEGRDELGADDEVLRESVEDEVDVNQLNVSPCQLIA